MQRSLVSHSSAAPAQPENLREGGGAARVRVCAAGSSRRVAFPLPASKEQLLRMAAPVLMPRAPQEALSAARILLGDGCELLDFGLVHDDDVLQIAVDVHDDRTSLLAGEAGEFRAWLKRESDAAHAALRPWAEADLPSKANFLATGGFMHPTSRLYVKLGGLEGIATLLELASVDLDRDGAVSEQERQRFTESATRRIESCLHALLNSGIVNTCDARVKLALSFRPRAC